MTTVKQVEELKKYLDKIARKKYAITVLSWEMKVVAPKTSLNGLINVMNDLERECFSLSTSEEYYRLLNEALQCNEFKDLNIEEQKYIQKLYDDFCKIKNVPLDFYAAYTKETNIAQTVWVEAKKANDYNIFKNTLEKLITLTKQFYSYMYPDAASLYDKMLDTYEVGVTSKDIDPVFDELKKDIRHIITHLPVAEPTPLIVYDKPTLLKIGYLLLDYIGYDNSKAVLDFYPHGFTNKISKDDVRIAFDEQRTIYDTVCTITHEGGHGIFEQNTGAHLEQYPGYEVTNMGLHESQSRFYENILGRNINFWTPIYDEVAKILNLKEPVEQFVKRLNTAMPSLIRTEADEFTYCMHIIVRYEIEKMIFNDDINIHELPQIWNDKMKEYLGVIVDSDAHGILQDVHWSQGSFGYFPDYLLGSIFDGMLLEHINSSLGKIDDILKRGDIKQITKYLIDNIHVHGNTYNVFELSQKLCGRSLSVKPIVAYFKQKYAK